LKIGANNTGRVQKMNTLSFKQILSSGDFDKKLIDIYVDEKLVKYQTRRYIEAVEKYESLYGGGKISVFSAPGRSEIGGNHTDHQQGEILAAAINLDAIAIVGEKEDGIVRIVSGDSDEIIVDTNSLEYREEEKETTLALIKGVLKGAVQGGYKIGGFSCYITSDVLIGAGLSSSAAFETLIGTIVSYMFNEGGISAPQIAKYGQHAENVYFGKPCGLMDQMSSSVGNLVHVDFADKENPVIEKVEADFNEFGYSLCITDTLGSHSDLTAEYAAIPLEMKKVAAVFGHDILRDITMEMLMSRIDEVRAKCGDRAVLRAIHFVQENARVREEVQALNDKNIEAFLNTVQASGNSSFKFLQNVYTNSDTEHQNISIALAVSEAVLAGGRGVSRVHGGGFAGTIQAFVKDEAVDEYLEAMNSVFGQGACRVLKIRKYGGMQVV